MISNSLKNKKPDSPISATDHSLGLRLADFPIGSVESRAAARALIQKLSDQSGPRHGDVIVSITSLDALVASEIYRLVTEPTEPTMETAEQLAYAKIWFKLPDGVVRNQGSETGKRLDMSKFSNDFLKAVICAKPQGDPSGFRNVTIFRDELLEVSGKLEAE